MVDKRIATTIYGIISVLFGEIADIDEDILNDNIYKLCDSEMPNICMPEISYTEMLQNMGWIYSCLVIGQFCPEYDIVERFVYDFFPRIKMKNWLDYRAFSRDVPSHCVSMKEYDAKRFANVNKLLKEGFELIQPYHKALAEYIVLLTDEQREKIGYVVSNFAYFIDGMSHDWEIEKFVNITLELVKFRLRVDAYDVPAEPPDDIFDEDDDSLS